MFFSSLICQFICDFFLKCYYFFSVSLKNFNFIEKLSKINTDKVNPLTSILDHSLGTREDKVTDGGIRDKILKNSPIKNEEFFIVPKVIE